MDIFTLCLISVVLKNMNGHFLSLLDIAKVAASKAGRQVRDKKHGKNVFNFDQKNKKEIKAEMDTISENMIIDELRSTRITILSEEQGLIDGEDKSGLLWIIDPIDGTYNYLKDLGPCSVSIALWDGENPVFGVIYAVDSDELFWGGKKFGSFSESTRIHVSRETDIAYSSVCTGFPVRLNMSKGTSEKSFWRNIGGFSKVRMLGCASISLLNIARGSSEVYFESQIMIWDVAAGLAILEGAGGVYEAINLAEKYSLNVIGANNEALLDNINL